MKKYIPLLFVWLSVTAAMSQPVADITRFTGDDGFRHSKVTGIIKDKRGFLWMSSWDGLYRYDGYRFVTTKITPGDGSELDNYRIDVIKEDKAGNFWCRSYDKLFYYDVETGLFKDVNKRIQGFTHRLCTLHDYYVLRNSYVLLYCNDGHYYAIKNAEIDKAARIKPQVAKQWISKYNSINTKTSLLNVKAHKAVILNSKTKQYEPLKTADGKIFDMMLYKHLTDNDDILWSGSVGNGLIRVKMRNIQYDEYGRDTRVICQYRDKHQRIWRCFDSGAVAILNASGKILGFISRNGALSFSKSVFSRVYCITEDKYGNVWLGTRGDGLFCIRMNGGRFMVTNFRTDNSGISDNSVYSLLFDHCGRLWVGTYEGGLNMMTVVHGKCIFLNYKNKLRHLPPHDRNHCVRSIAETRDHVILVGTSSGLYTFAADFKKLSDVRFYLNSRSSTDARSISGNELRRIYTVGNKVLVFTESMGICITNDKNLLTSNIRFNTWNTDNGAPSDNPRCMFMDEIGRMWIVFKEMASMVNLKNMVSADYDLGRNQNTFGFADVMAVNTNDGRVLLCTDSTTIVFRPKTMKLDRHSSPIMITDVRVFDRSIPYSVNSDTIMLQPDQRDFVLEFACLELSGAANVEYDYKLVGRDAKWVKNGHERTLHFFNLGAGTYTLLIKSTNAERVWTNNVRKITIIVKPTFWETGWAYAIYVIIILLVIASVMGIIMYVYRLRLKVKYEQKMTELQKQMAEERENAEMMGKLKVFMEQNLEKDIQMSALADCVGMGRTAFYNKLKSITGLAPVNFVRKYRLERAAQLLREDDMSVSEACYQTGFTDPKYFSKVFKKFYGVTPNDYRKGSR